MKSGVYQILHTRSGRCYVGSSVDIIRRLKNHVWHLDAGRHPNSHLQRAWAKHGAKEFEFSVLECCVVEDQLVREQHWIDARSAFTAGFNLTASATNTRGRKHSDKTRALLGRQSKERNQGTHHPMYGRKHSIETRARISAALKGRKTREYLPFTPEHRARLSEAARRRTKVSFKGAKHSEATRALMRAAWVTRRMRTACALALGARNE